MVCRRNAIRQRERADQLRPARQIQQPSLQSLGAAHAAGNPRSPYYGVLVTVAVRHSFTVIVLAVTVTASPSSPAKVAFTLSVFEMQVLASTALQNCASNRHE